MGCNCGKGRNRSFQARKGIRGMAPQGQRITIAPSRQLTPQQSQLAEQQKQSMLKLPASPPVPAPNINGNTPERRLMERRRRDIIMARLRKK